MLKGYFFVDKEEWWPSSDCSGCLPRNMSVDPAVAHHLLMLCMRGKPTLSHHPFTLHFGGYYFLSSIFSLPSPASRVFHHRSVCRSTFGSAALHHSVQLPSQPSFFFEHFWRGAASCISSSLCWRFVVHHVNFQGIC